MPKNHPPLNPDLNLKDRQLLETIGQEVLHASRRKVLLQSTKANQTNSLKKCF